MEYWTCDRVSGSSNVTVELFWENHIRSAITKTDADLVVARWNGSAWENAGQSAISGLTSGSVTSNTVSSFSPFTFGSLSNSQNPLPVELIEFTASLNDADQVDLNWTTASEVNNAYFSIERSRDGKNFEEIGQVTGAGTTADMQHYHHLDPMPYSGYNYYRLRQVDLDGSFAYSGIQWVQLNAATSYHLYPNPTNGILHVQASEDKQVQLALISSEGVQLLQKELLGSETMIDMSEMNSGVYYLKITEGRSSTYHKVVKR